MQDKQPTGVIQLNMRADSHTQSNRVSYIINIMEKMKNSFLLSLDKKDRQTDEDTDKQADRGRHR